jgi:hypothetical protein
MGTGDGFKGHIAAERITAAKGSLLVFGVSGYKGVFFPWTIMSNILESTINNPCRLKNSFVDFG